jgi:hypothetical protein
MDLLTAFTTIQTQLAALSDFQGCTLTPKHPDFTTVWPALYLEFDTSTPEYAGSRKSIRTRALATVKVHIQINSWPDHASLELLRSIALVEAKIEALTVLDATGFNCWVSDVAAVLREDAKWAWAIVTISLGSF